MIWRMSRIQTFLILVSPSFDHFETAEYVERVNEKNDFFSKIKFQDSSF